MANSLSSEQHAWLKDLGKLLGAAPTGESKKDDSSDTAVATSGNHDQQGYSFAWCEKYQGLVAGGNYAAAANPPLVEGLRGKLLLAYGDMDDNVHPALTLQLVDALIRADKDFELLVLPNEDHTSVWSNPWFLRRAMAFMVEALGAGRMN